MISMIMTVFTGRRRDQFTPIEPCGKGFFRFVEFTCCP
jgi:hypothetical protein